MKSELLHFRVCFEGLTRQARDFWMEGEYARALDLLDACNIPIEKAHDIIRGKLKMIQDPKGKKGVDGTLAEDNWKPNLDYCQHSTYPDPNDLAKMAQEALNYRSERKRNNIEILKSYIDELAEYYPKSDWENVGRVWELIDILPGLKEEKKNIPWSRKLYEEIMDNGGRIPRRDSYGNPLTPEELEIEKQIFKFQKENAANNFIDNILNRENREAPKSTKDFKKYKEGWILPNGKFYPCLTPMEHAWLSEKLGKTEKQAEEAGWVKVSYALLGIYIMCFRQVTQKQLDTLFDWSVGSPERESPYKKFMEEKIGTYNK